MSGPLTMLYEEYKITDSDVTIQYHAPTGLTFLRRDIDSGLQQVALGSLDQVADLAIALNEFVAIKRKG